MKYHLIGFSTALTLHAGLVAAGVYWYQENTSPPPQGTPVAVAISQIGWSQPEIAQTPAPIEQPETVEQVADQPPTPVEDVPPRVEEVIPEPIAEPEVVETTPVPPEPEVKQVTEPAPEPPQVVEQSKPETPQPSDTQEQPEPPEEVVAEAKETPNTDTAESEEQLQKESSQLASSAPGVEESVATDAPVIDPRLEQEYLAALHRALQKAMQYPRRAKRRRQEGVALVEFTVYREGKLEGIQLRESSGFPILDEAALDTVRSIKKFKPIPDQLAKNMLTLAIPIRFQLR
ncbi:energy transducer TonB [Hahella ganghwensis]|uniref:energy transducer TonB n=1 Tax=Hahella ganghwensis TaxID=286420 RepID=UPI00037808CF|nr:energy transducer TonB [Hahella ganghwensis]